MKLLISDKGSAELPSRDGSAHNMSCFVDLQTPDQITALHFLAGPISTFSSVTQPNQRSRVSTEAICIPRKTPTVGKASLPALDDNALLTSAQIRARVGGVSHDVHLALDARSTGAVPGAGKDQRPELLAAWRSPPLAGRAGHEGCSLMRDPARAAEQSWPDVNPRFVWPPTPPQKRKRRPPTGAAPFRRSQRHLRDQCHSRQRCATRM